MSTHVFICYAREDKDFVVQLASKLRDKGIPIWLDQWNIPVGTDWDQAIDVALKNCAGLLIILSPSALTSRQVRGEWQIALDELKVPIFPVLYKPCLIPRQLRLFQYADFTARGLNDEATLNKLVHSLPKKQVTPPETEPKPRNRTTELTPPNITLKDYLRVIKPDLLGILAAWLAIFGLTSPSQFNEPLRLFIGLILGALPVVFILIVAVRVSRLKASLESKRKVHLN